MEYEDSADTNKIFRFLVDFVHKELINEFIHHGECKKSTFSLLNWPILFDSKNDEIFGKLEKNVILKIFVSYLCQLFSKFLKTDDSDLILEISKILYDENLVFFIPFSFSISYDLKVVCYKMAANLIINCPSDKNYEKLKLLFESQDFVTGIHSNSCYSKENFYSDLCSIFNKDKNREITSAMKKATEFPNQISTSMPTTPHTRAQTKSFQDENYKLNSSLDVFIKSKHRDSNEGKKVEINEENEIKKKKRKFEPEKSPIVLRERNENFNERMSSENNQDITTEYSSSGDESDLNLKLEISSCDSEQGYEANNGCEEYSTRKRKSKIVKYWDDNEVLSLVYFVNKFGKSWMKIMQEYGHFFNNRKAKDLFNKYYHLEKYRRSFLDKLIQTSKSLEGMEKNISQSKSNDKNFERTNSDEWSDEELVYLVHGVNKLGRNWVKILNDFHQFFEKNRVPSDLCNKYNFLTSQEDLLKNINNKIDMTNQE